MKHYLLPKNGNFYKANLHTHSTISDGALSPQELKDAYKAKGYSVLAITDHEALVPHPELTDESFIAITSYEVATNKMCNGLFEFCKSCHLNLYAKDPNKTVSAVWAPAIWIPHTFDYITDEQKKIKWEREHSVESFNALIKKANEDGFLVCYNHPVWSMHDYEDYANLKGLWAVEIYNTGAAINGYIDTEQPFQDLLRNDERVFPICADDAHSIGDCFGGFTMIKAEKLDYATIMNALEKGDFYSSTAPEIKELYIEDGLLHISCSPVKDIFFLTERRFTLKKSAEQNGFITEATFDISKYLKDSNVEKKDWTPFFRLSLIDEHGKKASTRAYFLDELK